MSFLIDPPWLYVTGRIYGRILPEQTPATRTLQVATTTGFLATSVSLYLNRRWTQPIWKLCRAEDGRDWMLNSGLFRFDYRRAGRRTHLISALLFTTYPWWLRLGERSERQRERSD